MPTDTFQAVTAIDHQWDFIGDCYGYDAVVQGATCPVLNGYGNPSAKTQNHVAGNQMSGQCSSGAFPPAMVISDVQVLVKVWSIGYTGNCRIFCRVGTQYSYGVSFVPDITSSTDKVSGSLARPGGGTWTRTDLVNAVFGVEAMGDGPPDAGELRTRNYRIQVTYVTTSPPVADFSVDLTNVFEGDTATFTDLSTGTPTSWDWDFGDGSAHDTTQNPTHVYTTQPGAPPANKVTVTLIATNAGGSDTKVKTDYIAIWKTTDPVVASFTGTPTTDDAPLTVQFTDASTGYITSWDWDFGDGSPHVTIPNPSHTYADIGTYTVTLVVSNAHVNNTLVRTNYIVATDPRPTPDFTGTPTSGARPLTVVFTSSITNGKEVTGYLWDFGDGTSSILANPTHIYTTPGTYDVKLIASNSFGSHDVTHAAYITVTQIAVTADFSGSPLTGYAPLDVYFRDATTGDVTTWGWTFGDTGTSAVQNPTHTYRAAGTYNVVLVANPSTSNTSTKTRTGYVTVLNTTSYGRFFDELKNYLMENQESDICSSFSAFGGISYVIDATYDRICRFILETGILRKEGTVTPSVTGSTFFLPQDVIKLLRVEIDGQRYEAVDQFEADMYLGDWEATNGDLLGYIFEPDMDSLKIQLVPTQASNPTIKVLYLYAPSRPTKPSNCFTSPDPWPAFPIPYLFWWIIRFGVIADLLKMEGPLYDLGRAQAAEQVWSFGVEVTKLLTQEGKDSGGLS